MKTKSLLKNFVYKIFLNLFNVILPLLTIPYIYRMFEPKIMGQIEFSQSIMNYFLIFSGFGVYTYGLREISKIREDKIKREKLFTELYLISLISSSIVLMIYLLYMILGFSGNYLLKKFLLINAISIFSYIFYIEWINEAFENYEFITKKTVFVKIISVFCIFIFLQKENDYYKYLLIINGTIFLNNIISFIYMKKKLKLNLKNLNLKKYLFPLLVILLINNINILYTNLDKIALGFYTSSTEVAYYTIGQRVMSVVFMLVMAIITVSIPRLSYYLSNEKDKYINLLNKIINYMAFLIFPMSLGIISLREEIALFFGGDKYIFASGIVGIFGVRMIDLAFESILSNQIIFLHGKEKVIAIILASCGFFNFLLKFLLIKGFLGFKLNGMTAIITTILAEVLIIILDYIYIKKYLKIKIKLISKSMSYYFIISLFFIPITKSIKKFNYNYLITSIISVLVCSIIYILILFILKEECVIEIKNKIIKKIKRL